MDRTYNKETLSFYLVAIASALASVAAMCTSAIWRATGGVAVGFALFLPALVLACLGFSYPSPLNKVRCAVMLSATLSLCVLHACLFIAGDLAGAKVVLYTVAGVFQPNAMGVLLTVFMGFGLLTAILTGVRVMMQTFGKAKNDLERKLHVQSTAKDGEGAAVPEVTPRKVDEKQILAKADQEVRMNRINILPAESEGQQTRAAVPSREARARTVERDRQRVVAPEPTPIPEPVLAPEPTPAPATVDAEPAAPEVEAEEVTAVEPASVEVEQPAEPIAPVRSILDAEETQPIEVEPSPEEAEDDVIYAQSDDVDDASAVEVEMAHVEEIPSYDVRAEQAMHRPRQKDVYNDELYTDFSYGDKTPKDDD